MSFTEHNDRGFVYLTSSNIATPHAFTTRYGGVSRGIFSSMNLSLSEKDSREDVSANYGILSSALDMPLRNFVHTKQVHGTHIRVIGKDDCVGLFDELTPECDGLITNVPNIPLIAFTADCIPVLLYDPVAGAVGAVHAGWRGTVAGISELAVDMMATEYGCDPKNIMCAVGPGIGQCCFETVRDVPDAIIAILGDDGGKFFIKKGDKYFPDLKGVNKALLMRSGVPEENIEVSDECSMCLHNRYWSHRYTKGMRGNQACVIMLRGTEK